MRVVIDYRPALRNPTGVGEYARRLAEALVNLKGNDSVDVTIFSSSWKDRMHAPAELANAHAIDLRVPVAALNFAWHRMGWPPIERLTGGAFDVAHSLHPLLMPTRRAAQVITIHDLNFLAHPERTRAEIRRDYGSLAEPHASRADRVIVPSHFTAGEVERELGISPDLISVCSPGAPDWPARSGLPAEGYLLFFGTLEPRKNVGTLLSAYERLLASAGPPTGGHDVRSESLESIGVSGFSRTLPPLVLAGGATPEASEWLERIARPPLAGRVRHIGYVEPADRHALYVGATLLVQPSWEEGFGLPVLEAMTVGVPVVAANRGALPEVLGDAGLLVDPEDDEAMAAALDRMLGDEMMMAACASKGVLRARRFSWPATAERARDAYRLAMQRRKERWGG